MSDRGYCAVCNLPAYHAGPHQWTLPAERSEAPQSVAGVSTERGAYTREELEAIAEDWRRTESSTASSAVMAPGSRSRASAALAVFDRLLLTARQGQADSERLDWLLSGNGVYRAKTGYPGGLPTMHDRAAIDAARQGTSDE